MAAIILTIFVGFNIYHAESMRQIQSGETGPEDEPKTPADHGYSPVPRR